MADDPGAVALIPHAPECDTGGCLIFKRGGAPTAQNSPGPPLPQAQPVPRLGFLLLAIADKQRRLPVRAYGWIATRISEAPRRNPTAIATTVMGSMVRSQVMTKLRELSDVRPIQIR
jgi:hypothetical protein